VRKFVKSPVITRWSGEGLMAGFKILFERRALW
jgi:hypothetical protein